VTSHLVHFVLALPILFLFLVLEGTALTSTILALPLVIAIQFVLTLSLAYLLTTFHVTFRDTQYLLGVALNLLFFLTPVFYDANLIPERYQTLYRLNPMVHVIDAYRAILIAGKAPDQLSMVLLISVAAVLISVGYGVFTNAKYRFVDEL
jgi:lipopolysaccharide transport system permease protein